MVHTMINCKAKVIQYYIINLKDHLYITHTLGQLIHDVGNNTKLSQASNTVTVWFEKNTQFEPFEATTIVNYSMFSVCDCMIILTEPSLQLH